MKRFIHIFLFVAFLIFTKSTFAQIYWITDFEKARTIGKEYGKLMLIDFWADWCKPCRDMDSELWNNPKSKIDAQNFVAIKIDVMKDKVTLRKFDVTGIPKVVIAMADGTVIWEKTGFNSAEDYIDVINSIPKDVSGLYKCFSNLKALSKDSKFAFEIACEFQRLSKEISNKELRNSFIQKDIEYFKKSLKYKNAPEITCDIDLYLLLNYVYKNKPEKALKKFNKKYKSVSDCNNQDLAHFVLANCYKQLNDDVNFLKEIDAIKSKELLTQLE